jgi:hypothetical protein
VINASTLLASLPPSLRTPLIECYQEIVRNYTERRWEPAELNGGKFCEIVYTILDGALSGAYAPAPAKPANMVDACRKLEQNHPPVAGRVGDRSLRVLLPRLLPYLYEIRNNRNVGHVGGEVDPNHADAEVVLSTTTWVMAELVRIFHNVPLTEAQEAVETIIEKRHPLVWKVGDVKRVLDPNLTAENQTLVLLYSENGWVDFRELCKWVEYAQLSTFKTRILKPLHAKRQVEFDSEKGLVRIAPPGMRAVEERLPQYVK